MRIFVKYNTSGKILSASKIKAMPVGLDHPYADLEEDEQVLEVEPVTEELKQLETLQFHDAYQVDVAQKKLVKKT